MEDAGDYTDAFETELILLLQQGLGLGSLRAARVRMLGLYPPVLRTVSCEVGRRLELPPAAAAAFFAVMQTASARYRHARWRRILPWVPGGRLRMHDAIARRAGLAVAVDRDNDNFIRFMEVVTYALTGTRRPTGRAN